MTRFVFCPVSEPGDLYPSLAVAVALRARGHHVVYLTAPDRTTDLTAEGIPFVAIPGGVYGDEAPLETPGALLSLPRLRRELAALDAVCAEFRPDVLVDGAFPFGPRLYSEMRGLLRATLCAGCFPIPTSEPLFPHGPGHPPPRNEEERTLARLATLLQAEREHEDVAAWDSARAALGLAVSGRHPWRSAPSHDLVMLATSPAMEYPRPDLPPQFWFVGPLPWRPGYEGTPGRVASLTATTPIVFVSQGGTYNLNPVLLKLAITALRDAPLVVLGTTVREFEAAEFGPLSANVILERFVPIYEIASKLSLVITHGGAGTVHAALAHGIPLIITPFTADQFEVAARCVWAGVGIRLDPWTCTPDDLRVAVETILGDSGYRDRARRVMASHARMGGADFCASLLERLARSGRRVERAPTDINPWNSYICS